MAPVVKIKKSPIVLIRNLFAIEAAAFVLYLIATQLDDYKYGLYSHLPFSAFLSYEATKILFLSGAQLVITIYAFLRWYFETYTIRQGTVSHSRGIIFKKNRTISNEKVAAISLMFGPIGKVLKYGSLCLEDAEGRKLIVFDSVPRPRRCERALERMAKNASREGTSEPDLKSLLEKEENEGLEFKSSFRFDVLNQKINRDLEKAAMKTVAAFLNSKGGHLVIGVNDHREPIGLSCDYNALGRKNSDGFENHFTQVFNKMIGPEFRHFIKIRFRDTQAGEVCVVQTLPSTRPVYLKYEDGEHFYIRTGNISTPLKLSEVETYSQSRWPGRF